MELILIVYLAFKIIIFVCVCGGSVLVCGLAGVYCVFVCVCVRVCTLRIQPGASYRLNEGSLHPLSLYRKQYK